MPAVFTSAPGKVSVVSGNGLAPSALTISTGDLALTSSPSLVNNAIVTSISVEEAVNSQFMHSLNRTVHAYVFGDKVGRMVVGGMAFGGMCAYGTDYDQKSGLARVQEIYRDNKMSSRARPIMLDVSGISYSCFLTGANFGFVDPQGNVAQWTYTLSSVMTSLTTV